MSQQIHPTAIVDRESKVGPGVTIGPYSIIGKNVTLEEGVLIDHHVVIEKNARIGAKSRIYPFCSIGTDPQDVTYKNEETFIEIGQNNTIREFVQMNRGTAKGGNHTILGDNNYIMAYSHVGHDCRIGNNTILINGATLAGHVVVEDYAVVGAFSSVHQFVRIGRNAYIGGYTIVLQDILPYAKIAQNRDNYSFYGPNAIGMRRSGISNGSIATVKEIFNIIYKSDLNTKQAVARIEETLDDREEARVIIDFINQSKRGLLKNFQFSR